MILMPRNKPSVEERDARKSAERRRYEAKISHAQLERNKQQGELVAKLRAERNGSRKLAR